MNRYLKLFFVLIVIGIGVTKLPILSEEPADRDGANYLLIPVPDLNQQALVPDGKVENGNLYLNLDAVEAIGFGKFDAIIEEKIEEGLPFILMLYRTKSDDTISYRFTEATYGLTHFYGPDLTRNRYEIPPSQFPRDPVSRQPVRGHIFFFAIYGLDEPVELLGSDYDLFRGEKDKKWFLTRMLLANKGDQDALFTMGVYFMAEGKLDRAEGYLKQAIDAGSFIALYELGYLYQEQGKLDLAQEYYQRAIDRNDKPDWIGLALLALKQNNFALAEQYMNERFPAFLEWHHWTECDSEECTPQRRLNHLERALKQVLDGGTLAPDQVQKVQQWFQKIQDLKRSRPPIVE